MKPSLRQKKNSKQNLVFSLVEFNIGATLCYVYAVRTEIECCKKFFLSRDTRTLQHIRGSLASDLCRRDMSMLKIASTSFSFLHFSRSHITVCAYFQKLTHQSFSTKQLPSRKKPSGNICNYSEKKFAEVRTSFFNNQSVR